MLDREHSSLAQYSGCDRTHQRERPGRRCRRPPVTDSAAFRIQARKGVDPGGGRFRGQSGHAGEVPARTPPRWSGPAPTSTTPVTLIADGAWTSVPPLDFMDRRLVGTHHRGARRRPRAHAGHREVPAPLRDGGCKKGKTLHQRGLDATSTWSTPCTRHQSRAELALHAGLPRSSTRPIRKKPIRWVPCFPVRSNSRTSFAAQAR